MTDYRIFHNLDSRFFRPFEPGDRLVAGHEGTAPTPARDTFHDQPLEQWARHVCEAVFGIHNRDNRPDGQTAPSLSVGDVVVLGESAWTVDRFGFAPVNLAEAGEIITDRTMVDIYREERV